MAQEIIELESSKLMNGHTGGRATFHGSIGDRWYQVFCMEDGLLFLDVLNSAKGKMTDAKFAMVGGLLGGMVGASVGMMLDQQAHEKLNRDLQLHSLQGDDELLAMAKGRKHSFVVFYDEFKWSKLEAPPRKKASQPNFPWQGRFTFKAKGIGKKQMDLLDANVMAVAVDSLPRRMGDRFTVNAHFDDQLFLYVAG